MPSARPPAGHAVAALGALLTITALWMPWYALASSGPLGAFAREMLVVVGQTTTLDAWTVFGATDALLAGAAALVLLATVAAAGDRIDADAAARGVAAVGAAALFLVVLKLVDQPGPNALLEVRHGAWAAASGCALMLAGGLVARRPSPAAAWTTPDSVWSSYR